MRHNFLSNITKLFTLLIFTFGAVLLENNSNNLTLAKPVLKTEHENHQGLIGAWYRDSQLKRVGMNMRLKSLDIDWGDNNGHGNDWSAQWIGYITAPVTGKITIHGASNQYLTVKIANKVLVQINKEGSNNNGILEMIKDKKYPIHVKYMQPSGGKSYLRVYWSWSGRKKQIVPHEALSFSDKQAELWHYVKETDVANFDFNSLKTIPEKNYVAFSKHGMFAGWPANNGVWQWGNEILVGFELGIHNPNPSGTHAIFFNKPTREVLARSMDGGETWKIEYPKNYVNSNIDKPENIKNGPGINFEHPGFAMRISGERYFYSYDRGKTWLGPYRFIIRKEGKKLGRLTSRTDYIVLSPKECLVFMSAETGLVESNYQDRSFCAETIDGGKTFRFLGWMTNNTKIRSVMSSSVCVGKNHLVSVMRRKHQQKFNSGRSAIIKNWIEAAESLDNGKTWKNLGMVATTDFGEHNGNPPAMVKLQDGRLCVAYGYRAYPYGIRLKISKNNGKTWGNEIVLRDDGNTWDLGYPRMVVRPDGKVVVMYYYNTKKIPSQFIGVTIFDPAEIR